MTNIRQLVVVAGESNSGGAAPVSGLPSVELEAVPNVRMWNNATSRFESLKIGTNNLIGHAGFVDNQTVGIERGLVLDRGKQWSDEVYFLKSGQGGSTIERWAENHPLEYLKTLTTRYLAAKAELETAGYTVQPVFVWWLGLNDAALGTPSLDWRVAVQAFFSRIRILMGANTPIYSYKLMENDPSISNRIAYNKELEILASNDPLLYPVSIAVAEQMIDRTHYTIRGYATAWDVLMSRIVETQKVDNPTLKLSKIVTPGISAPPQVSPSKKLFFSMAHTCGESIAHGSLIGASTMQMKPISDPDQCFALNGFRVPVGGDGYYLVTFDAAVSRPCYQFSVSASVNNVTTAQAPVSTFATDCIYSNGSTALISLKAGDLVTLCITQVNTKSQPRSFLTSIDQRPKLSLAKLF